jgi:sRNA-binding carbon storage regulator CsrA
MLILTRRIGETVMIGDQAHGLGIHGARCALAPPRRGR